MSAPVPGSVYARACVSKAKETRNSNSADRNTEEPTFKTRVCICGLISSFWKDLVYKTFTNLQGLRVIPMSHLLDAEPPACRRRPPGFQYKSIYRASDLRLKNSILKGLA